MDDRPLLDQLQRPFDRRAAAAAPEALAEIRSARPVTAGGPLAPALVLAKRAIRRMIAWYVRPIASDQSRFNEAVIGEVRDLETRLARLEPLWAPDAEAPGSWGGVALATARAALVERLRGNTRGAVLALGDRLAGEDADLADGVVFEAGDPASRLQAIQASSLSGVYLAGVLTRVPARELVELIAAAWSRLAPGGWLAADAPDPAHPHAPRDPSAIDIGMFRWLLPETAMFLLDAAGFNAVEVVDVHMTEGARAWYAGVGRKPA